MGSGGGGEVQDSQLCVGGGIERGGGICGGSKGHQPGGVEQEGVQVFGVDGPM